MRVAPAALGLAAAVFLVYGWVAGHELVAYDSRPYLTENPWVLRGLSLEGLRWAFTSAHAANWHPLTWLSLMLDVELFGLAPGLIALENVAWHAANAVLLFLALERMTGAAGRSLFVAALFALHPLHVESVAWIVERKDVLSAFFGLVSLLAWLRWTRGERRRDLALAVFLFALSLLAKPMLVTWPFVLLLLDRWPLRRSSLGARRLVLEKLPFFTLAAGSAVATLLAQRAGGAVQSLANLPLASRLANAALAYAAYLAKTFWPVKLAFYYPHDAVRASGVTVGLACLGLAAATALAFRLRRAAPYLLVGWLFFLGTLVPVIGLVQVGGQAFADRYTYLPIVGVFVAVAWGARDLADRAPALRPVLAPLAAAVLLALGFLAWRQVGTWKDSETLARHALAVTERNHVAHDVLGIAFVDAGRLPEAEAEFREALAIAPGDVMAASNLGAALQRQGRFVEAEAALRSALALTPENALLHRRLAIVLQLQGRYAEALDEIDQSLAREPLDAIAFHVRALLEDALDRTADARRSLARSLAIDPGYAAARLMLARLLLRAGEVDAAEREIGLAIEADPANPEAHRGRARALLLRGRERDARGELEEALRLQPGWALAMGDLAFLLATAVDPDVRDSPRAVGLAEAASRASAGRAAGIQDALAAGYASAGRFQDAVATAEGAAALARAAGDPELAARIEKRLAAYRAGTIDRGTPR
jgi:Flp pilus assembly protein TadD